ncbi:MAG: hypothetical protein JJE35_15810 [Thermoleophilia bacterium]|nr:hypothetical protein [Thermoleophilia bacterium]
MRQSWSDDRLDDLNRRVDDGFVQLRTEMRAGFAELRAGINGLRRTLLQVGGGLIGTVIAATSAIVLAVS